MSNTPLKSWLILSVLFFFHPMDIASSTVLSAEEKIEGDDRIAVLKMLAARNEANYKKIKTWQSTYHFVERVPQSLPVPVSPEENRGAADSSKQPQVEMREIIGIREGTVEMALDVAQDKLWVAFKEDPKKTRLLSKETGKTLPLHKGYKGLAQETIVAPDSMIDFRPHQLRGPVPGLENQDDPLYEPGDNTRMAERKEVPRTLHGRALDSIIDPREFYSAGSQFTWVPLKSQVACFLGKFGEDDRRWVDEHTEIAKTGAPGKVEYLVTTRYHQLSRPELDAKGLVAYVRRFSEHDGFLPVEVRVLQRSGEMKSIRELSYRRIDGVWVPKTYRYVFNRFKDPGLGTGPSLVLDRHLSLVDIRLNEPIDEARYSADSLSLHRGDRFVDRIENRLFVHDGKSLSPIGKRTNGTSWLRAIGIAVGLVLLLLAIRRFYVKRFKCHAR